MKHFGHREGACSYPIHCADLVPGKLVGNSDVISRWKGNYDDMIQHSWGKSRYKHVMVMFKKKGEKTTATQSGIQQ